VTFSGGNSSWFAVGVAPSAGMEGADVTLVQPGAAALLSQTVLKGLAPEQFRAGALPARAGIAWNAQTGAAVLTVTRPWAAASYTGALGITSGGTTMVAYAYGPVGATILDASGHASSEEQQR